MLHPQKALINLGRHIVTDGTHRYPWYVTTNLSDNLNVFIYQRYQISIIKNMAKVSTTNVPIVVWILSSRIFS